MYYAAIKDAIKFVNKTNVIVVVQQMEGFINDSPLHPNARLVRDVFVGNCVTGVTAESCVGKSCRQLAVILWDD